MQHAESDLPDAGGDTHLQVSRRRAAQQLPVLLLLPLQSSQLALKEPSSSTQVSAGAPGAPELAGTVNLTSCSPWQLCM